MLITTTHTVQNKTIKEYYGIVTGETIMGANVFKDLFASIRDFVGGRSAVYEKEIRKAKDIALKEMQDKAKELKANAIIGVDIDYETLGDGGSMMMVTCSGTAVQID